jgi:hypothetical protein
MKIIDTINSINAEVTLSHPNTPSQVNNYLIDFENDMKMDTEKIIQEFKNHFKNSHYHYMHIVLLYVFDNETYRQTIYIGEIS